MDNIYDILNKFNSVAQDKPREQITEGVMEVAIEEIGGTPVTAKQKAFAKLAPPADKITFADKIAGAKKEVDEMLGDVAAEAMKKAVVGLKNEAGMEEDTTSNQLRKVIKKNGKPVGEVGIDPDAPPGRPGQWYMKHYASGHNLGGYDSREEAMSELKHCLSQDMEEGNDFTGARLAAIKAGKPTFSVAGKTYKVTGDTSDEKMMEKKEKTLWPGTPEYEKKFPKDMKTGEKKRSSTGGEIEKTATGIKHTARSADDEDEKDTKVDDGAPKKKGRPKGSKRALGAKGPSGNSKLLKKNAIKQEEGMEEDYQPGEYDREGEMAKSQSRTISDAAEELQSMLGDDENLPEWVQKKIALAQEYIDAARDYLKSNRPGDDGEEVMAEKAVSKAQRAAAGIAYAAKKGEIPKSKLRGASKEMAKMGTGELKKFAKTKEKGLPEKVKAKKEESKEEVEETTTSGSVATAPAEAPKGKKGMVFGKGVYEGKLEESYKSRLEKMLTEGISINASQSEDGTKSLSVNATDEDAVKLAQLLQLAGMPQGHDYHDVCPACGKTPCGCEEVDESLANSPDPVYANTEMINTQGEDLHKPKSTGQTTVPVLNKDAARQGVAHQVEKIREETEGRLWKLYQKYEGK